MSWIVVLILLLLIIFMVALALAIAFCLSKQPNGFHGTQFKEPTPPQSKKF
jgi:flagellar basal body-associated protein FliL